MEKEIFFAIIAPVTFAGNGLENVNQTDEDKKETRSALSLLGSDFFNFASLHPSDCVLRGFSSRLHHGSIKIIGGWHSRTVPLNLITICSSRIALHSRCKVWLCLQTESCNHLLISKHLRVICAQILTPNCGRIDSGHATVQQCRSGIRTSVAWYAGSSHRTIIQRQHISAFLDSQSLLTDNVRERSRSHCVNSEYGGLRRHSEAHRLLLEQVRSCWFRWGFALGVRAARRWWRPHHCHLSLLHPSHRNVRRR